MPGTADALGLPARPCGAWSGDAAGFAARRRGGRWLAAGLALVLLLALPAERRAADGKPAQTGKALSVPGHRPSTAPPSAALPSTALPSTAPSSAALPSTAPSSAAPPRGALASGLAGRLLGDFRLTYYRLAQAQPGDGQETGDRVPVYGRDCGRVLAWVSESFHSDLGLQGSGILADGRLLNFEQRCPCAAPTRQGERICYEELRRSDFPFGRGAPLGPVGPWQRQFFWLQPFRSAAVDPGVVPLGSVLYIPALRGRRMADGVEHNGCVRAEDTGRAIRGRRLDLFAGAGAPSRVLARSLPDKPVPVYLDSRRCVGAFP